MASQRIVAMTGAASYLGQNLLPLLEQDDAVARVVAVDIRAPHAAGSKTRFYEVDLTQPAAEARLAEVFAAEHVDTLVHLAFSSSPSHASAYAHELESVGTMHLLVAARETKVRKLVMGSLTLLYGAHPSNPNFLAESQPLRATRREPFFTDKIEAEGQAARWTGSVATVLRVAPLVGPTVDSYLTRYLSRRVVLTMMGFDPLVQLLHELDAIAAFKLAIDRDVPGTFNICPEGVLPLSAVIRACGRAAVPVPYPLAESLNTVAWIAQASPAPSTFLPYLRFLCVADGARARAEMGFRPAFTSREALDDFVNARARRRAEA